MKVLRSIKPNMGIRRKYERKLGALLEETHRSILWWIRAAYRRDEDRIVVDGAEDASPARNLEAALRKLLRRWEDRWDEAADEIADEIVQNESKEVTSSMIAAMRDAGWMVSMPKSRVYNAALQSYIVWNKDLIRSVGSEYLAQIQSVVMRCVAQGNRTKDLEKELYDRLEISRRRANFIARDQVNKINHAMVAAHCADLGVKRCKWIHIPGTKTSRPTHIDMDGQTFDPSIGMWDPHEQKYVKPTELPGCQCQMRPIYYERGEEPSDELQEAQ